VAKSYFNDTFKLYRKAKGSEKKDVPIDIIEKNIAWSSDIQYKFANVKSLPVGMSGDWRDVQWLDMTEGKYDFFHSQYLYRALHRLDENCWSSQLQKALGKNRLGP
jgi:hypothetical protein